METHKQILEQLATNHQRAVKNGSYINYQVAAHEYAYLLLMEVCEVLYDTKYANAASLLKEIITDDIEGTAYNIYFKIPKRE